MDSGIKSNELHYIQSSNNALSYKCKCIDYYLRKYNCNLVANEFRYGRLQLVTDLVVLTSRNTISIEIKAENDDLRRIPNQILEAKKNFNLIIVFAAAKHIDSLLSILPVDVGLITLSTDKIITIRNPKRQIIEPAEIIYSIPISYLRTKFDIPNRLDSDQVRKHIISNNRENKILSIYREFIIDKYQTKFYQFMSDRGVYTHIEDIPTLSMREDIALR